MFATATVLALAATAGTANAASWTEIPSGTTEEITAVEYRGGDQFWFTTANGKIFRRVGGTFQQEYSQLGVVFRDIEFDPSGTVGLAVGTGGAVARTTNGGADWASVGLPPSGDPLSEFTCSAPSAADNLDSVRIDGTGRAWISGKGAQLWRSTGTGMTLGTGWEDANGVPTSDCRVPRDIDDMFFVPGSAAGYFIAKSFGQVYFTSNRLDTTAAPKGAIAGNGFQQQRRAVGDPANPNRMWTVYPGDGISYVKRTTDGWNSELDWTLANRDRRELTKPHDIDYASGTLVAAGDAGLIMLSTNGADFFFQDATGTITTQDWRAVSVANATNAAIGGTNGKLAVTSSANVLPDIAAPTGTISGPSSVRAGQAATFTLNAADTGGSGINPASIRWTTAGLPERAGNPVSFTFPDQGFATMTVTFADNAGNSATASASVTIGKPSNALPVSFTGPGNKLSAKIKGRFIRVTMKGTITLPAGATAAACAKRITLRIKKKQRVMTHRKAKLRHKASPSRCTFSKKVKLRRKKVGKIKKLRLTVSHPGNSVLRKSSKKLTLVIKK
jgi:photosystem II stability/assembly factor-like uncharacterized protein